MFLIPTSYLILYITSCIASVLNEMVVHSVENVVNVKISLIKSKTSVAG